MPPTNVDIDHDDDYLDRLAQQFADESRRAEDMHLVNIRVSRQHYQDMLNVWRHCRQVGKLKPAALRLEKLAREVRDELDRLDVPPLDLPENGNGNGHSKGPFWEQRPTGT